MNNKPKPTVTTEKVTTWQRVVNAARKTSGKGPLDHEPQERWRYRMLLSEHSPIRQLLFDINIESIRQFVTVHLVRHKFGVEHFVHSQREDRRDLNGIPRDKLPQGALNDMQMSCNAQSLISISRKRLCNQASIETREAWNEVKDSVSKVDPEMAKAMVPECIYRGFCPEMKPCGYCFTKQYEERLNEYRSGSMWNDIKNTINDGTRV